MRSLIVLATCLCAAGCSSQTPASLTAPTSRLGNALDARGASDLPVVGSFTLESASSVNCPPTCPPTVLRIEGHAEGVAGHLGRFTTHFIDLVNIASASGTGTWEFTAANGDVLHTTTEGAQTAFVPPNESHIRAVATITGGTGRFANASGTLVLEYVQVIDFGANTAAGSGTVEGSISLKD